MTSKPTIISVGEALVDFVSTAPGSLTDSLAFVKKLGGEAANVAVGIAKLGSRSVFVGRVGNDSFGRFLVREMREHEVDVRNVVFDKKHKTRLAFVSLKQSGERDFEFWEKLPAGAQLQFSDITFSTIRKARIVNIGGMLLTKEPARTTALRLAEVVVKRGGELAFDANVRLSLWNSAAEARRVLLQMVKLCSILRLNDDEAKFLTGKSNIQDAAKTLGSFGPKLVVVTLGSKGCYFQTEQATGFVPGYNVKAVDTTGCGDAFFAALLHGIAQSSSVIDEMSEDALHSICLYANAVGALTSLKYGGADGIPYPADVLKFLKVMINR